MRVTDKMTGNEISSDSDVVIDGWLADPKRFVPVLGSVPTPRQPKTPSPKKPKEE